MGDTVFDPVERAAEAIVGRLEYLGRITPSWRYDYLADARELARVVVDALGLTEETRVLDEGMGGGTATFARLVGPWAEQWERSEK